MINQKQCKLYCAAELEALGLILDDGKDAVKEEGPIEAYGEPLPTDVRDVLDRWGMCLEDRWGWLPLVHLPRTF